LGVLGQNLITKVLFLLCSELKLLLHCIGSPPDLFVGEDSFHCSHVAWLLRKKSLILTHTDNAPEQVAVYKPFATKILTPACFRYDIGPRHERVNSFLNLAYLHPDTFTPDAGILAEAGLQPGETFFIIRFVSWNATHDLKARGLSLETKRSVIETMRQHGRVFITSESALPDEFSALQLNLPPEKIHHLLFFATLLYGESGSMAAEAALLGTHAIFCDHEGRGYTDELEEPYELVYNFRLTRQAELQSLQKLTSLLSNPNLAAEGKAKRTRLLAEKEQMTEILIRETLRYDTPESA
jgi:predicted glycosyltransferase